MFLTDAELRKIIEALATLDAEYGDAKALEIKEKVREYLASRGE